MLTLWNLEDKGGFTNDILKKFPNPKPAYTTLATFMKILTNKGFVNAEKVGSMLYYTPKFSKTVYFKRIIEKNCADFFDGNTYEMIRFATKNSKLTNEQKESLAELFV